MSFASTSALLSRKLPEGCNCKGSEVDALSREFAKELSKLVFFQFLPKCFTVRLCTEVEF